MCLGAGALT